MNCNLHPCPNQPVTAGLCRKHYRRDRYGDCKWCTGYADGHAGLCRHCRLRGTPPKSLHRAGQTPGMKWCYVCETMKSTDLFHKNRSRFDGLTHRCKPCSKSRRDEERLFVLRYNKLYTLQTSLGLCVKCWKPYGDYHIDHILPKSLLGGDEMSNYQIMCGPCNVAKGNRDQIDYRIEKSLQECYIKLPLEPL